MLPDHSRAGFELTIPYELAVGYFASGCVDMRTAFLSHDMWTLNINQPIWINTMHKTARLSALLIAAIVPFGAMADVPGNHPAYLHALSDLRAARWLIEHRAGDAKVSADEDVALTRIDETIREIKRAAIEDGKNVRDHVAADERLNRDGRLHRAEELLTRAHADVAREEDDPMTRGLRDRAIQHLDDAMHAVHRAIHDVQVGN
jgi:hypothetical protein